MRLRVIATFFAIMALSVGMASAQSIGLFSDDQGNSCNASIPSGTQGTIYILALQGGDVDAGITGAEFQVTGLPGGWFLNVTRSPNANVDNGDPFGGGTNIAFPGCQPENPILLFTVGAFNASGNSDPILLSVEQHTTPSNPNFLCPLVTKCDDPFFTIVCTGGGQLYLNDTTEPCTVAVDESSWSEVKSLYNN